MKKTIFLNLSIVVITSIFFLGSIKAQKIGHINSSELIQLMPEKIELQKQLEEYKKQLENQLKSMSSEYQSKVADYQEKEKTWSDVVKQTKVKEITEMEARIQEFSQTAEKDLIKKEQELVQPLLEKVRKAIKDVAAIKKYDYIFDTSAGNVLHYPDADNLLPVVKSHLKIQ